jgi:hypothetical protein
MRAYVVATGTVFGLLAVLHVWRVFAESTNIARDPWYIVITCLAAALAGWAFYLVRGAKRAD